MSSFKVRSKHFSYSFVITETSLSSSSKMAGENKQSNMKIGNFQFQQISGRKLWCSHNERASQVHPVPISGKNKLTQADPMDVTQRWGCLEWLSMLAELPLMKTTQCADLPSMWVIVYSQSKYYCPQLTHLLKSNIHPTQPNFYMMWPRATLSKSDPSTLPPPPEEVINDNHLSGTILYS